MSFSSLIASIILQLGFVISLFKLLSASWLIACFV